MIKIRKSTSVAILFAILFYGIGGYNFFILNNTLTAIFFLLSAVFFIGIGLCTILLTQSN